MADVIAMVVDVITICLHFLLADVIALVVDVIAT